MYTLKEKKYLLCRLVELYVLLGYSISELVGKPLSYYDFDKISANVDKYEKEYESM